MFEVLPIDAVRDEDAPLVGEDISRLAKLSQLNFPVPKGLVVLPPDFKLRTILKMYHLSDRDIFEQTFTIIKKEVLKIEAPESLQKEIKDKKANVTDIWQGLLEIWIEELKAAIWKEGLSEGITKNLQAQTIFFEKNILISGRAWEEKEENEVKIEVSQGRLEEKFSTKISELVRDANKKLFLPQVYFFIITGKSIDLIKIIKVYPFTQSYSPHSEEVVDLEEKKTAPASDYKSALKIFSDFSTGLITNKNLDGAVVLAEKVPGVSNGIKDKFEALVFRLVELAQLYSERPVIFKLSDLIDQKGGVRGALRLIHSESLLREETEAFLFARNKKSLLNLSIAIPFVRSINEFLQLKRDLASKGISRKGSLKLWLEMAVPENLLNLEEYLVAGLDGVILNLDELAQALGGFDMEISESVFYKNQVKALVTFIEEPLKILRKAKMPVLALGKLALNDELLEALIKNGVFGVVADQTDGAFLDDHLRFVEKRLIRLRTS